MRSGKKTTDELVIRSTQRTPCGMAALGRLLLVCVLALPLGALASEASDYLERDDLEELVYDKTADCQKIKDDSTCVTYFSSEGNVAQYLPADDEKKTGRWFLDDDDRLCILWDGRIKPLCFHVYANDDGTYRMIKNDKHLSSITALSDGNRDGL